MKKILFLLAVGATLLTSCNSKGYKITGTVEGANDGDSVYIIESKNRQAITLDSTVIANGKFEFKGVQDSAVYRYFVYKGKESEHPIYVDFFLENGDIQANIGKEKNKRTVLGTPSNLIFQKFREDLGTILDKRMALYSELSKMTEEEQNARMGELEEMGKEAATVVSSAINQNITTPLGVFLLKGFNYYLEDNDVAELLEKVPAQYQNDEDIIKMNAKIEAFKATAVGQKFTDLAMNDEKGNPVKLSDYAGKGKVVLVDFWASWCGPCRQEMPNLVDLYAKYKNKNFEIVGVSFDRTAEAWNKGIQDLKITWPQMSDLKYWESDGAKVYAISGIPHVMLIDADGTIAARGLHGDDLKEKVAEMLK